MSSPPQYGPSFAGKPSADMLELPQLSAAKESFSSELPSPVASPRQRRWNPARLEDALWSAIPIILYLAGIAIVAAALFQTSLPCLSIQQVGGTGAIDFGILGSCAITPNSTVKMCTSSAISADFTPSLIAISTGLPGFAVMNLPFRSVQSQTVFVVSLVLFITSFLFYLPVWTLYNFPSTRLPRPIMRLLRFYPKWFYQIASALSFIAMCFIVSIGVGYKLLMLAYLNAFNQALLEAYEAGLVGVGGTTLWDGAVGPGFDLVWAGCVFVGLTTVGIHISLHQCDYEKIERYEDDNLAY
ncbi:hypothetical protein P7C70_g4781, partial [Phenoliferia sp. Uapishka_3]